jgi:hypothetical protein
MTFYDLLDDEEEEEEEEEDDDGAEGESRDGAGDDAVLDQSGGAHGMSLDASDVHPSRYTSLRSYVWPRFNHNLSQFADCFHV